MKPVIGIVLAFQVASAAFITNTAFAVTAGTEKSHAAVSMAVQDQYLEKLYTHAKTTGVLQASLESRLDYFSKVFFGVRYLSGALGEGANAKIDKDPLYRFDAFDCTTYTETVIALAKSNSPAEFRKNLMAIRYKNGQVGFYTRNHFTSLDWNKNNEKSGLLTDVTTQIAGSETWFKETVIEKNNWYRQQNLAADPSVPEKQTVTLAYISKEFLINSPDALATMPSGVVINIVRKNWQVREVIGTDLDISHQGIGIRNKDGVMMFRNASFRKGTEYVLEIPLRDYIQAQMNNDTWAGINVLKIK
jgi:hypothetical protein